MAIVSNGCYFVTRIPRAMEDRFFEFVQGEIAAKRFPYSLGDYVAWLGNEPTVCGTCDELPVDFIEKFTAMENRFFATGA